MKAIMYYGKGNYKLEEIITPDVKDGEILLKVKACSICGTDLKIINFGHNGVQPPAVIGHEIAGIIEKTGNKVKDYRPGDRVVVVTPVGCGKCAFCREGHQNMCFEVSQNFHSLGYYCNGGFAEYMLIPKEAVSNKNLIKIPSKIDFDDAALVEPFSCVVNGQNYLSIQKNDLVVIFGSGPIGCMHAKLAQKKGAKKVIIVDVAESKLKLARRRNVGDIYLNSGKIDVVKRILKETDMRGANVVVVACASGAAQELSLKISGIKSRISFFGGLPKDNPIIKLDSNNLHYAEKSIFGSFASSHLEYHTALDLISDKNMNIKNLITHNFKLSEFGKALKVIEAGKALKVVINP